MSSKVRTDSETEDEEVQHGDSVQEERKSDDHDEKTKMKGKYLAAANDYYQLKFSSLRQAAIAHWVKYTTLYNGIVHRGGEFQGSGKFSTQLTPEEKQKFFDHVNLHTAIGYWVDWLMLQLLLHEILLAVTKANWLGKLWTAAQYVLGF